MRTTEGRLICIVGIDGSGKTTLTTSLKDHFQREGLDAEYVWCRFESKLLAFGLKVYNYLFHGKPTGPYRENTRRKRRLFKHPLLGRLYRLFVVQSYSRQIRKTIARPLKRGKTVFCDRYVYDSVVDLALDSGLGEADIRSLNERFLARAPKPALVIFVSVDPAIAMARKHDVPELSYLSERAEIYERIRKEYGFHSVDGSKPPQAVFEEALAILRAKDEIAMEAGS